VRYLYAVRYMALTVTVAAGSISLVTSIAVGFGLSLSLSIAGISASLGALTVVLVWLLRRRAFSRQGYRW